ncbi:glutathione S-transferase N-terminal domain-containing protein [Bradyrhizobium sp. ARR65]|uniref:glutathione S-transferase N-terminal domain-containing protein n=1 Tax=Bradyrhizobium sp. ARR65 TaxID=1040989 RepID=UPI000B26B678|nr:glutathione S-transferase N-terminal domain-containing protein [Bradyrhizobium sp. ARR65]
MLTVSGEGRGFRVIWLLEQLGLAYRLRPVDLLAVENDRDFLAINPAGFIPALQDGETIMVESIAILEYLLALTAQVRLVARSEMPGLPAGRSRLSRAGWGWLSAASRIAPISPATASLLPISR